MDNESLENKSPHNFPNTYPKYNKLTIASRKKEMEKYSRPRGLSRAWLHASEK